MSDVQGSETEKTAADYIKEKDLDLIEFLFNNLPHYIPRLDPKPATIEERLNESRFNLVRYGDELIFGGFVAEGHHDTRFKTGIAVRQVNQDEVLIVPSSITSTQASHLQESDVSSSKNLAERLEVLRNDADFKRIYSALTHQIPRILVQELWALRDIFKDPDALKRGRPYYHTASADEGWLHLYLNDAAELSEDNPEFRLSFKPNLDAVEVDLVVSYRVPEFSSGSYRPISEGRPEYYELVYKLFYATYDGVARALNPSYSWYK